MRQERTASPIVFICLITLVFPVFPLSAEEETHSHPLAVHMNQWLTGSREWTTPNPDHEPEDPDSFAEFRVYWDWGPFKQQLFGKLFGVTGAGKTALFWNMYATYNPATRTVIFQQVGWNGAYITGENPVRDAPLPFGEIERLETDVFGADGNTRRTRHDNVFSEDGSHQAEVYELNENGEWQHTNSWTWKLVGETEALGASL